MSIMSTLFRTAANPGTVAGPTGSQVPVAAPAPVNPTAVAGPVAAPGTQGAEPTVKKDDSPLAGFDVLWQNPTNKDGTPVVHTDPLSLPVFNFDPVKIQEQAKSLDFVKGVTPEMLATAVDADGRVNPQGLMELMNSVQQNAFSAATITMGKLVNDGMATHTAALRKSLPTDFKRQQLGGIPVNEEYRDVLEHPAVRPLIGSLRTVQFNKNPNANPQEVAKQVDDFVLGLATAINDVRANPRKGGPASLQEQQQNGSFNWEGYFDGEGSGAPSLS